LADVCASRPEPSLSLPIRLEKKRQTTRIGAASVAIGVVLLGGSAYHFGRSGSVLIAIYLAILGSCMLSFGIAKLVKASHS
jgi:hypothetical protein